MSTLDYFSVRTQAFGMVDGPLTYDVYLRLSPDKFTKIFSCGQTLERERLNSYYEKGTKSLFVERKDRLLFLASSVGVLEYLRKQNNFDNEESQQILDEITFGCLAHVYSIHHLDPNTQAALSIVVDSYVNMATNQPQVLPKLLLLARKKPIIIRHQVMAAVFGTLLAAAYDGKDNDLMTTVGLAGLVHDIGLGALGVGSDEHSQNITKSEQDLIHLHPKKSVEIIGEYMTPAVKNAVLQHHEANDGSGYPQGLSQDAISLPARILRVAEEFSGLVTGSEKLPALPPPVAAHAMTKSPAIDPLLLSLFVKMLKLA